MAQAMGSDMNATSILTSGNAQPRRLARPVLAAGTLMALAARPCGLRERKRALRGARLSPSAPHRDALGRDGYAFLYRHHQAALRERSRLSRLRQDRRAPRQYRRQGHARHDARPSRCHATIGCRSNWRKPSSRPRRAASSRPTPTRNATRAQRERLGQRRQLRAEEGGRG